MQRMPLVMNSTCSSCVMLLLIKHIYFVAQHDLLVKFTSAFVEHACARTHTHVHVCIHSHIQSVRFPKS